MGRNAGGVKNGSSTHSMVNEKRRAKNSKLAKEYEQKGYVVEKNMHPNGAFFAQYNVGEQTHSAEEIKVGRIFAENGFSFTLDKEGIVIRLLNGRKAKIPTPDGHTEGFTAEIYTLNGAPDARRVATAIEHSFKQFNPDRRFDIQSDIAITIAPKGSSYHRQDIEAGVKEFRRKRENGETKAKPLIYLHVDETSRKVYYREV